MANELDSIQKALRSGTWNERREAVSAIQQAQMHAAIPALLNTIPKPWGDAATRKINKEFGAQILETLVCIEEATEKETQQLQKWIHQSAPAYAASVCKRDIEPDFELDEFLINLKIYKLLLALARKFGSPIQTGWFSKTSSPPGVNIANQFHSLPVGFSGVSKNPANLRYAVAINEVISDESEAVVVANILMEHLATLGQERLRWKDSWQETGGLGTLGISFLLSPVFGSLVAVIVSPMVKAFFDGMANASANAQAKSVQPTSWLSLQSLTSDFFRKLPESMQYLTALRAYATGFAKLIGGRYGNNVKYRIVNCKTPLQIIVLALARAFTGDAEALENLITEGTGNSRVAINRILGYEGLVLLANNPETAEKVKLEDQVKALTDKDPRVRILIASLMAKTQNPIYEPYLLELGNAADASERQAAVAIFSLMAQNGSGSGLNKLRAMAETDKDNKIRLEAKKVLDQIEQPDLENRQGQA